MIDKNAELTSMKDDQLHVLNSILDSFSSQALSIKHTSVQPTVKTVSEGQVVIYDDGSNPAKIYVVTAKGNLKFVTLS